MKYCYRCHHYRQQPMTWAKKVKHGGHSGETARKQLVGFQEIPLIQAFTINLEGSQSQNDNLEKKNSKENKNKKPNKLDP